MPKTSSAQAGSAMNNSVDAGCLHRTLEIAPLNHACTLAGCLPPAILVHCASVVLPTTLHDLASIACHVPDIVTMTSCHDYRNVAFKFFCCCIHCYHTLKEKKSLHSATPLMVAALNIHTDTT